MASESEQWPSTVSVNDVGWIELVDVKSGAYSGHTRGQKAAIALGKAHFHLERQWCGVSFHATTILSVRHAGTIAMGGDGQVTLGSTVMKADAVKIRRLMEGRVLCGFAGSSADAFALLERFEAKLKDFPQNVPRAATELAREWRTDRALRRLEALLTVADNRHSLLISGTGDVIQPSDGILGIGSGGTYAIAAARALVMHSSLSAADIVRAAMKIAGELDIYTNTNIVVEEMSC